MALPGLRYRSGFDFPVAQPHIVYGLVALQSKDGPCPSTSTSTTSIVHHQLSLIVIRTAVQCCVNDPIWRSLRLRDAIDFAALSSSAYKTIMQYLLISILRAIQPTKTHFINFHAFRPKPYCLVLLHTKSAR